MLDRSNLQLESGASILGACQSAQAGAKTSTKWPPASSGLLRETIRRQFQRTPQPWLWGGLAASRAVKRGLLSYPQGNEKISLSAQRSRAGKRQNSPPVTAEVAILNRNAVALAADSAASTSSGDSEKVYNTNKLFSLSKYHPVGIMFYGNAEFLGIPVETLVKLNRDRIGKRSQGTTEDYLMDFLQFLTSADIFSEKREKAHVESSLTFFFEEIYEDLFDVADYFIERTGRAPRGSVTAALRHALDERIERFEKMDPLPGLDGIRIPKLETDFKAQIKRAAELSIHEKLLTANVRATLSKLASEYLVKWLPEDLYSGVVAAGFGDNEIFPALCPVVVDGTIYGRLKHAFPSEEEKPASGETGGIYSFAQSEMVHRFMEGVDSDYQDYIEYALGYWLRKFSNDIIRLLVDDQKVRRQLRKNLPEAIKAAVAKFAGNAQRFRRQEFVRPVLDILNLLPKEELATMAEGLVNVTSIKRRMSTDKETVGGPVDVAVISKGDGFVWIKRKHYFTPNLNPQFIQRYFLGQEGGNAD